MTIEEETTMQHLFDNVLLAYPNAEATIKELLLLQQNIDIEKACVLYRKEIEQAELIIKNINPKGLGLIDIDKSVEKFKQAMEE